MGSGSRYLWSEPSYLCRTLFRRQTGTDLAISLRSLTPFLPPSFGSSRLAVTRSILDMTLIHGISRFTIADIAESTPLGCSLRFRATSAAICITDLKNLYRSSMNCDSIRYTAHVRMPSLDKCLTRVGRNG